MPISGWEWAGNEGANPVESIPHGLAGCMTTTMALHTAAHGKQADHIESSVEGDLDVDAGASV